MSEMWQALSAEYFSDLPGYYRESRFLDKFHLDCKSILEIGCGAGQLATMLRDKGFKRYHGFDFSPNAVELSRSNCPQFQFDVEDVNETKLIETCDYDTVVCTEVFEHLTCDLDIFKRIRHGTQMVFSVPNFPSHDHVRYFKSPSEVHERYGKYVTDLRVDTYLIEDNGNLVTVHRGLSQFSRRRGLAPWKNPHRPRKWDCPPRPQRDRHFFRPSCALVSHNENVPKNEPVPGGL
jgi:SAM-dependent methyltransferase